MDEIITFGTEPDQVKAIYCSSGRGKAPGVLLFHAWWGLNTFFKDTASRLSQEGYAVLAPDYSDGQVASTIDEAQALRSRMDRKRTYQIARQALDFLLEQEGVYPKKVAAIGVSLGCSPALELARSRPECVKAVVLFYGSGGGKFDSVRADFLGHFAQDDQWGAHADKTESLRVRLSKSGGEVNFHTYPNTRHWFFESDRPEVYNKEAADEAWERTVAFLKARLP